MIPTLRKAVEAYGGNDTWMRTSTLEAEFSAGGWAFVFKRRAPFRHASIVMDTSRPYSRILPIGRDPHIAGVLDGPNVRLENRQGETLQERKDARRYFPGGRRTFYWDDLDMAYFANYAMWNYLTLPALLLRRDITWEETDPGRLEAKFPRELPTHSRLQHFRFDPETGLLRQHDYTAKVIGRWAKAAHVVFSHSESKGLSFSSHRRVTPRSPTGRPLPGPTLIEITIHAFRLKEESPESP